MQKKVVLDTIRMLSNHPTVDDVYAEVKKSYPSISKNTIYRNLRQIAEDGEIQKVLIMGEPERYDNIIKKHYHFQCKVCDSMYDVEMDYLENINETAKRKNEHQIDEHDIVFRGICSKCRSLENDSNNQNQDHKNP